MTWAIFHTGDGIAEVGPNAGHAFLWGDDIELEAFSELWGEFNERNERAAGDTFSAEATHTANVSGSLRHRTPGWPPAEHTYMTDRERVLIYDALAAMQDRQAGR